MASRKYNEFLDDGPSDDEVSDSHNSDGAQETKGRRTTRHTNPSKKQKTGHDSSEEGSDDDHVSEPEKPRTTSPKPPVELPTKPTAISTDIPDSTTSSTLPTATNPSKPKSKAPPPPAPPPRPPRGRARGRRPPAGGAGAGGGGGGGFRFGFGGVCGCGQS